MKMLMPTYTGSMLECRGLRSTKELESFKPILAALVTEGVTDLRELRRRVFEAVACTIR